MMVGATVPKNRLPNLRKDRLKAAGRKVCRNDFFPCGSCMKLKASECRAKLKR